MAGLVTAIPIIGHCAIPIEIAGTSPAMTPRVLPLLPAAASIPTTRLLLIPTTVHHLSAPRALSWRLHDLFHGSLGVPGICNAAPHCSDTGH